MLENLFERIDLKFSEIVLDEHRRIRMQYLFTYVILAVVSLFMTFINLMTGKTLLMISTLVFSLLCALDIVLLKHVKNGIGLSSQIFQLEFLLLLTFFIVTGTPEGFSAIWAVMLPACGMLLFQRKRGTVLSAIMLAIILFFFWTPLGRSFLQYDYTQSFMLRFPMLYVAFYLLALFLETIRKKTADNYQYQSLHDPLTKILNRRGFNELISQGAEKSTVKTVIFMIFDIDHFKTINDNFGHFAGDAVLMQCAKRIQEISGLPLCRWGGEEFALYDQNGYIDEAKAKELCRKIQESDFLIDGKKVPLTVSIGAVRVNLTNTSFEEAERFADRCLYEAKGSGRNKAVFKDLTLA